MFSNQLAQFIRSDDFNRVAPFVKMLGHLQPTARLKADDQTAILVILQYLIGMKHIVPGEWCRTFVKAPNHGAKFGF
jgi:hypothetical protein